MREQDGASRPVKSHPDVPRQVTEMALKYRGPNRKRETNDVDDFFVASLRNEERKQDAKTTAADLTRGETARHRIRERNGRCATIKPECRGAPRPRETPKFSSIFLSQKGRVGAEDAFAIRGVLF